VIVAIHQPDYIPYPGLFYKISRSDIFVWLDDAQFSNDNTHNWNKIKTSQGECRIKVPVDYHFGEPINRVKTRDELEWKEKHLKTIRMNYAKAYYYKDIYTWFSNLVSKKYSSLAEMNIAINTDIAKNFGFKTKFINASDLMITTRKEERVIDICKKVSIGYKDIVYFSGRGAMSYEVPKHFLSHGITLQYTNYNGCEYKQLWDDFIPNMSILDYLLNYGFNWQQLVDGIKNVD